MLKKNHFSFLKFISKTRAWMSEDILCLVNWRKGKHDLTQTIRPPLLPVASSLRGLWNASIANWAVGKD